MIPVYNPRQEHLEQALQSVLAQDPGPARMQIEVVDDCSPNVDVAALVKSIAGERVAFSRNAENLGLTGGWNSCAFRANGEWVHILHQDDYVLPGFYVRLGEAAKSHPEVGLIATRCFLVDEHGVIQAMTERLPGLERGGKEAGEYLYSNPFRCPGIAVRRAFYESHGGFRTDLTFTLDWELWIRAITLCGGIALPDVLAAYRTYSENQSARLGQDAATLRDRARLTEIFAEKYPAFDRKKANKYICLEALQEGTRFAELGNEPAASANLGYFRENAPMRLKLRISIGRAVRKIANAL
jgi:glycosyltransferase involved in cell wall biosynthesis